MLFTCISNDISTFGVLSLSSNYKNYLWKILSGQKQFNIRPSQQYFVFIISKQDWLVSNSHTGEGCYFHIFSAIGLSLNISFYILRIGEDRALQVPPLVAPRTRVALNRISSDSCSTFKLSVYKDQQTLFVPLGDLDILSKEVCSDGWC